MDLGLKVLTTSRESKSEREKERRIKNKKNRKEARSGWNGRREE